MTARCRVAAAVVVLATALSQWTTASLGRTDAARAQPQGGCVQLNRYGECVQELPVPVGSGTDPAPEPAPESRDEQASRSSRGGSPAPPPVCRWQTARVDLPEETLATAPAGMVNPVQQWYTCDTGGDGAGVQQVPGVRWVDAGPEAPPAPVPPPATMVALTLYARVQTVMQAPRLATNPPGGAPAVVNLPVFVEVENWQGEIHDRQCVLGVCVEMTASPSLEFDPGEPGAPVIECDPPGSRFDSASGDAQAQASTPGACAYAYERRTGVADRPVQWPGEVTVRWAVSWTSNVGASGTFPELAFSAAAPRVVDEVQTVVADDS